MKYFKAKKINGSLEFFQDFQSFVDKLKDGAEVEFSVVTEKEYRTLQHNRYLWGYTYRPFTPQNFQTVADVHKYFGAKYLKKFDTVDFTSEAFIDFFNEHRKIASKMFPPKRVGNKLEIEWIESTTNLSPKRLNDYIKYVQLDGNELGIEFEEFDKNIHYK